MSDKNETTPSTTWMVRIVVGLFLVAAIVGGLSFFVGGGQSQATGDYSTPAAKSSRDSNPF